MKKTSKRKFYHKRKDSNSQKNVLKALAPGVKGDLNKNVNVLRKQWLEGH